MPEWAITVLGMLVAALPGLYAIRSQQKKVNAEATQKVADAAVGLLDDFREENTKLRQRVGDLEVEREVLHETLMSFLGRNRVLEAEVERLRAHHLRREYNGEQLGS
jgi:hypothetical protein